MTSPGGQPNCRTCKPGNLRNSTEREREQIRISNVAMRAFSRRATSLFAHCVDLLKPARHDLINKVTRSPEDLVTVDEIMKVFPSMAGTKYHSSYNGYQLGIQCIIRKTVKDPIAVLPKPKSRSERPVSKCGRQQCEAVGRTCSERLWGCHHSVQVVQALFHSWQSLLQTWVAQDHALQGHLDSLFLFKLAGCGQHQIHCI